MTGKNIRATKLVVGLPFNLGKLEFEPDEVQPRAAWELYVELSTRIAVQPLGLNEGMLREALLSPHSIFGITRNILRSAGPAVAKGPSSFGPVAIQVLNKGIRSFLSKWDPVLRAHEETRPVDVGAREHEVEWERNTEFRRELAQLQEEMVIYLEALATIAGIEHPT